MLWTHGSSSYRFNSQNSRLTKWESQIESELGYLSDCAFCSLIRRHGLKQWLLVLNLLILALPLNISTKYLTKSGTELETLPLTIIGTQSEVSSLSSTSSPNSS